MTDELELDSANIFERLIALIAISSPEVALTMKDGSIKRVSLDVDKILAELQKAKSLVERARRLEREADWLAAKLVCASTRGRSCVFGNGHICVDCDKCRFPSDWREAARRAVESKPDLFDHLAEHPDTKFAPEEPC